VKIVQLPSVLLIVTISLLACSSGQPTVEPASQPAAPIHATEPASPAIEPATPEPKPQEPEDAPTQPSSESPGACQVQLVLEAPGANGRLSGSVTLQASVKNLTDGPLTLTLEDRCPGGEAWFSGLEPPDGSYDYYRTCAMGACMDGRPPKVFALSPGETVEIASAEIDPAGKKPCNRPIATGTYQLSFSLHPVAGTSNPVLCGPEPLELRRK
jgi:hypothetical protein